MQIYRSFQDVPAAGRGAVTALGNFDGVHRGHRAVIETAARLASGPGAPIGVLVFEPHPRQFFAPHSAPFRLTSLETKARLLSAIGVDILYALTFNESMAGMSPQDFIFDVLVGGLGVTHAVAGQDFRFGKARAGDMTMLAYVGEQEGFGVTAVDPVFPGTDPADRGYPGGQISSSAIRAALQAGEPDRAAKLLGRPWCIEGLVVTGDQRGRTIGFPTANVMLDDLLEPALGVYAVLIEVFDGPHAGIYEGVANVGKRPTFGKTDVVLEANVFEFAGDLYGATVSVSLISFLRAERKFDGLDALKTQIAVDAEAARAGLANARDLGILPRFL